MNFESYGPFEFDWWDDTDRYWRATFWSEIENRHPGLSEAIGCYVYCLSYGETLKPWYVGMTVNRNGFKGEVFESHKIDHYDELMDEKQQHKAHLMFFPLMTKGGDRFSTSRKRGAEHIEWLETTLISMAYAVNPDIRNRSKTAYSRYMYVNGLIGKQYPGRRTNSARRAAQVFGID